MITVYDADALIDMGHLLEDGTSHLTRIMAPTGQNLLHAIVNQEVKFDPVRSHLNSLIRDGTFLVQSDHALFQMLKADGLKNSWLSEAEVEQMVCLKYRKHLLETIELTEERRSLMRHYQNVLNGPIVSMSQFLQDIETLDMAILHHQLGVGELKTVMMLHQLHEVGLQRIKLFFSNDGQALSMAEAATDGDVLSVSVLGSFVLL